MLRGALVTAAVVLAAPAFAGQTCETRPLEAREVGDALALAQRVTARLPDGAGAAVLARVGADVSSHGLRWTHAGLLYRRAAAEPWRVLHKLNNCGSADSALYRHGLGNFFLDDPHELRAWLLVPEAGLQARLLAALEAGAAERVSEPRYSMIAYPFAQSYQNSNQWLLELVAVAAGDGADRAAAQRFLRRTGYVPGRVRIPASRRLAASLFRANVAFSDHPLEERLRGRYGTVTVESIEAYLRARRWLHAVDEIALAPAASADR